VNIELPAEIHLLLDDAGALIVYEEADTYWTGLLAFSSEAKALAFAETSHLDAAEVAALETADAAQVAALIRTVKQRAVRHMLLDLDYRNGQCLQVEFEQERFGAAAERQLSPRRAK